MKRLLVWSLAIIGLGLIDVQAQVFGDVNDMRRTAPAGFSVGTTDKSTALLSWEEVEGETVEYYGRIRKQNTDEWLEFHLGDGSSMRVVGLDSCGAYEASIRAIVDADTTLWTPDLPFNTEGYCIYCGWDRFEPATSSTEPVLFPADGIRENAFICPQGDKDVYQFETSGENVRIRLYNIPEDYELEVYDADGLRVGTSKRKGLMAEVVNLRGLDAGTYYIHVFGANNVRSNPYLGYSLQLTATPRTLVQEQEKEVMVDVKPAVSFEHDTLAQFDFLTELDIFPNPATDLVNITFKSEVTTAIHVRIKDLNGKIHLSQYMNVVYGYNKLRLPLDNLTQGMYIIEYTAENQRYSGKVVVK